MVIDSLSQCQQTIPLMRVTKHEEDSQKDAIGKCKPSVPRTYDFSRETKSQFF